MPAQLERKVAPGEARKSSLSESAARPILDRLQAEKERVAEYNQR
nr:hypothetical protein [Mycobacterium eburneum]